MGQQLHMFSRMGAKVVSEKAALTEVSILTWNISNPSKRRAINQFDYLMKTKANVIILTEAKDSEGSSFLYESLINMGFKVYFEKPAENYAVIIAERGFTSELCSLDVSFLSARCKCVTLETFLGKLKVIGMYVPSRGPIDRRNIDKRAFQDQMIALLKKIHLDAEINNLIAGGDLNVIEPGHIPHYSFFGDWEYDFYNTFLNVGMVDAYKFLHPDSQEHSWFGKLGGDGYRFDHLFIAQRLGGNIKECCYLHEPRELRLSDHSAMQLVLKKND